VERDGRGLGNEMVDSREAGRMEKYGKDEDGGWTNSGKGEVQAKDTERKEEVRHVWG